VHRSAPVPPRRLTRAVLLGLLTALVGLAQAPAAHASGVAAPPRAMWVWSFTDAAATVDFATTHGIQQLFVAVPPNVTTSPELPRLKALASAARAAGLRVDALGGDPGWIDNQQWVVDRWLKPAIATGLFTGVHVDIEPYGTPAWTTDQAGVVSRYLATLTTLRKAAGAHPLEADIPFWFNQVAAGSGSTLDREIMKRTAAVTLMAYRNTATGPDGTLAVAAAELSAAASLGTPVRIGQETNDLGTDPSAAKQTFAGMTVSQMQAQLTEVDQGAAAWRTYAGIAVQDYAGFQAMTP
jgi:hypothetical protein